MTDSCQSLHTYEKTCVGLGADTPVYAFTELNVNNVVHTEDNVSEATKRACAVTNLKVLNVRAVFCGPVGEHIGFSGHVPCAVVGSFPVAVAAKVAVLESEERNGLLLCVIIYSAVLDIVKINVGAVLVGLSIGRCYEHPAVCGGDVGVSRVGKFCSLGKCGNSQSGNHKQRNAE